jgi:DNA-directed RNA polymerase subunit RPC12/RpoP
MPDYYCPRCGAMLEEGFLATAGQEFDCPECDERVRLDAVSPELSRRTELRPDVDVAALEPESPPGTRIDCRVADRQLVIYLKPGSSRAVRGIGCFAAAWLGFIGLFSGIILSAGDFAGPGWTGGLMLVGFLGIFWAVGLGMLYFWLRGRFGKSYILVEPERLVLKTELFGREKFREYVLDPQSRAALAESYRQNEQPVYKVAVTTAGKTASFGTFLSDEEKNWLVERINRHLGR